MNEWTKWTKQSEEMFGNDVVEQLAFLSGCTRHRLVNDSVVPDGWIVSDEVLRKFAELIVAECQLAVVSRIDCSAVEAIKEHFEVE